MVSVFSQGRDREHRSCATVPSAFPSCGLDGGLHSVSAELNGQVKLGFYKVIYGSIFPRATLFQGMCSESLLVRLDCYQSCVVCFRVSSPLFRDAHADCRTLCL